VEGIGGGRRSGGGPVAGTRLRSGRWDRGEAGSPADELGLKPNDLLVELNGQFPATLGDLGIMWEQIPPQSVVRSPSSCASRAMLGIN